MDTSFLSATILLVLITDPLGNIPFFISALRHVKPERKRVVVVRECLIAFAALLLFLLAGRPILLVNVASFCGFTPQYAELQKLHETYGPRGLVVLGVPSNDCTVL